MAYFNTCPNCGASLDPGERCDCREQKMKNEMMLKKIIDTDENGQMYIVGGECSEKIAV